MVVDKIILLSLSQPREIGREIVPIENEIISNNTIFIYAQGIA